MFANWTFGRKIAAGFAVVVAFAVAIGAIATFSLNSVVDSKDLVITVDSPFMLNATRLGAKRQELSSDIRSYLLSGDPADIATLQKNRNEFSELVKRLEDDTESAEGHQLVAEIEQSYAAHAQGTDRIVSMRQSGTDTSVILRAFDQDLNPLRDRLDKSIAAFLDRRQTKLEAARQVSTDAANLAVSVIIAISIIGALIAAAVAVFLARSLNRQIGSAVGHVESSSSELQAAANQQATGVREQVTSMNEINTTISELLATSRQIAESAQRVAEIAEETTSAAQSGDGTVERASGSILSIRQQVDLVVGHMLELGKKSQQIGAVLDIVTELAEQTNILSINATIEAAGAGEAGKRFAIVADEIRKLADRVAGSAKEIRTLIDDVRTSVNTTVMATETGSKAVDSGSRQFGDVATVFRQIADLVRTTTEAAREIELSTKQQATAVEQVNIAIANVAQATKETEASAGQTIDTATALAGTSRDLLRMVRRAA